MPEEATQAEAPEADAETTPEQDATPEEAPKTFDAEYVKTLRSESAAKRVENQQLREKLEEYEEAQKTEVEKLQSKAEKTEARAAQAEAKLLRYEIAQEKSVPAELIPLLSGSDRESLEAQADLIVKHASNEPTPTPEFDGGAREPAEDSDPGRAHDESVLALLGLTSPK